jgi:serine/threonine protein kinase
MLDAHVTDPPYFLALEYLDGETLHDRLQRDYALDLRTTVWIGRQMAEALAGLHRAGFIHGDVKPENVRLLDAGTAVLVDLGFAHRPGETGVFADEGYVLGTANYLAPELCGDDPHDGPAADWFSFGVMLFESLTGELPYPHGPVAEMLADRRRSDMADALAGVQFTWPPRLTALLQGLLSRRPEGRPAGALIVHELVALEIAALGRRRAG